MKTIRVVLTVLILAIGLSADQNPGPQQPRCPGNQQPVHCGPLGTQLCCP